VITFRYLKFFNNIVVILRDKVMAEDLKKVVCIEDELEMIELVKLILGRNKFDVTGAVGGHEGLEKITEIKPDLVLLDLMMPEMDGWEVYQKMKASEEMRDIPVIVVTAKAQSIDRVLGLHIARVDDYITKPFGPQELLDSVERVINNRDNQVVG
jgi:two-component system response regulator VicR